MVPLNQLLQDTKKSAQLVLSEFTQLQIRNWPLANSNFRGLKKIELKTFQFGEFQIVAQFNPERIQSSVAEVDKKSIAARPCFLCNANRPKEQAAIPFGSDFLILVNPYPIFENHFTISCNRHTEQRFIDNAQIMLELAATMQGFTILYNGPECGASAPDHLHFQAGNSDVIPLTEEFDRIKQNEQRLFSDADTAVWAFHNFLRKMISIESSSMPKTLKIIQIYYQIFSAMQPDKAEPMMNALCSFQNGRWTIHFFPRRAHRSSHFYAEAAKQILVSPGSVDFAGLFIFPRREDFDKITESDLTDIFEQVCLENNTFQELSNKIQNELIKFTETENLL
jgi:hypothetical protein